jgi:uncharacterized protein DUF6868
MTIEVVRHALLWCSIIDYGILLIWFLVFRFPHHWIHQWWGQWFGLTAERSDVISAAGMVFFKAGILLFNIVPYVALRLVA